MPQKITIITCDAEKCLFNGKGLGTCVDESCIVVNISEYLPNPFL